MSLFGYFSSEARAERSATSQARTEYLSERFPSQENGHAAAKKYDPDAVDADIAERAKVILEAKGSDAPSPNPPGQ